MTEAMPLQLLRRVSACLLVTLVFTNVLQFGVLSPWLPLGITSFAVLMAGVATILIFSSCVDTKSIVPIFLWSYCFVILVSARQLSGGALPEQVREVGLALSFVVLLVASLIVFADGDAERIALKTVVVATFFSVLLNVYEFMNPGSFSTVPGRSAGLYENPNTSGAVLVMGMVLGTKVLPAKYRLFYQILVGVGVVATVSRGGVFGWLCAFVLLQFSRASRKNIAQAGAVLLVGLWALYVSPFWSMVEEQLLSNDLYSEELFGRLQFTRTDNIASDVRTGLLAAAWDRFLDHPFIGEAGGIPLFGDGPSPQGPHNMFLLLLVQYGVAGGLIMAGLIAILMRAAIKRSDLVLATFAIVIGVQSFFTHNMFTQYPFAIGIALAVAMPTVRSPSHSLMEVAGSRIITSSSRAGSRQLRTTEG